MAQTDKMKQTLDKLEAGVREFYTSEKFITYLQVMSRFHNYSLEQPDPDRCADAGGNNSCRLQFVDA